MITENLSTLKIHKLTQEQYDRELEAGRVDPSALYLTPDDTPLSVEKGGTGATDIETARSNLGLGNVSTENIVPVAKGGTGANNSATARSNLGAAPMYSYGTTDLTAGSSSLETGKLHFVYE